MRCRRAPGLFQTDAHFSRDLTTLQGGAPLLYNWNRMETPIDPKWLLLSPDLDQNQVFEIFSRAGFKDPRKGDINLQLIADEPRARHLLAEIITPFLESLSRAPDPDQALNFFERFSRSAINKVNLLSYLQSSPYTVWLLAKVFGTSPFLSEVLIRYPHYLYWVADSATLDRAVPESVLAAEFSKSLRNIKNFDKSIERLAVLKHKELLRIGIRDLLNKASLQETVDSLSSLASVLLGQVLKISKKNVDSKYGSPVIRKKGGRNSKGGFTILAMGKLGGGELNFSSDIDLLFVHETDRGKTSGKSKRFPESRITNGEYFIYLAQEITSLLTKVTSKGSLYRVDLRLRPEGKSGEISSTLARYRQYYLKRGETWEKLALTKAWPVAGDLSLGKRFLRAVSGFIYRTGLNRKELLEIKAIKDRIDEKMADRGKSHLHVKLGIGGIREIEFVVQTLQIYYGKAHTGLRERNTLKGLTALYKGRRISRETFQRLTEAYIFLRRVENSLQMVQENQVHSLPEEDDGLRMTALRLDYRNQREIEATTQFMSDYRFHTGHVNRIFERLFRSSGKIALPF